MWLALNIPLPPRVRAFLTELMDISPDLEEIDVGIFRLVHRCYIAIYLIHAPWPSTPDFWTDSQWDQNIQETIDAIPPLRG